ncbi:MAG: ATP-binding cassette domain-containing protein [Deltaproteobacteria bacterium]|nr:ATP-binding cassette domain-containing protein [Deltaproteobacteria bacterium]MDZ4342409.1 ATP-binding cassette domain-containing protein [Candidatus Binatia bacterium]
MNDAVLRLEKVCLDRGPRRVLESVTFAARRGEIVALMGPSGAGKTTALRVVAGLETFHSGTVQVDDLALPAGDATPPSLRALRRKVGMVFQFHHLFEHLTALKNVWLAPVYAHGVLLVEAERRARELLKTLGVEHRANALPRELSGGEAQRVAIARALAVDPPLLLLDEPTASLDPGRRTELRELLRGLTAEGRTLVVATHDEDFARGCATRVLRMQDGVVSEI